MNRLSKKIVRIFNFLYILRVVYIFTIPLFVSGCSDALLGLTVEAIYAPVAIVKKSQFVSYESEHNDSFSECGEITVGGEKYDLQCSNREVSTVTQERMKKVYRYYLIWGYSNHRSHLQSAGYGKDIITARFNEINNIKVSYRPSSWRSSYGELDYYNDVKDIGRKSAISRSGLINSIDTQGDNYRGLRFFFYHGFTNNYSNYAPAIVYSSDDVVWDKPDWDIEVRAYSSKESLYPESAVNEQIYEALVNLLLNKFNNILTTNEHSSNTK